MEQTCRQCSTGFETTQEDQAFYDERGVPTPKNCPDCRLMRRMTERNARTLYKRTCDLTGREFISPYHTDHVFPVYHPDVWWSDKWDEMTYGKNMDFSQPFFPQFKALLDTVPRQGQFIGGGTLINSDYVNCASYLKDCYLIAETDYNENCYYGNRIFHCKSIVDCSNCYEDELCYECVDCGKCYDLRNSDNCLNCSSSAFLRSCIGCKDCIGCINQRQKQYMIFNEQFSKEEYEARKREMKMETHEGAEAIRQHSLDFFKTQPQKNLQNEHNELSSGNHLHDSKNAVSCTDCKDLEDCKWVARAFKVKSSRDYTAWGDNSELMYQCAACGENAYRLSFCSTCVANNSDLFYCAHSTGSSNCFGCVGIRKKKYCILNKQYTKEEYETLMPKIIEHMRQAGEYGEFFPKDCTPFGYNETIAMEYFPLSKEQALKLGFRWRDQSEEKLNVSKMIPAKDLPNAIEEVPDDILQWAVSCEETNRPFRITKQELEFYRQHNLPLPRFHPDIRHAHRMKLRPYTLFKRNCDKCDREIMTTFGPERPEIVYCEECYLKDVY
jgi:hypothetical protein